MALIYEVNQFRSTQSYHSPYDVDPGGWWAWKLKELLKSAGWVVAGSGDGLAAFEMDGATAGSGGHWDVLTTDNFRTYTAWGSGGTANDWANPGAWMLLRHPGSVVLEILIVRDTAVGVADSDDFAVFVSPTKYGTAGASATTPPNATAKEQAVRGARTPTYDHVGTSSYGNLFFVISDSDINGVRPFCVFRSEYDSQRDISFAFYLDALSVLGSVGDPQPYVIQCYGAATGPFDNPFVDENTNGPEGWEDYGGGSEAWRTMAAYTPYQASIAVFPGYDTDGRLRLPPAVYGTHGSDFYKGLSYLFRLAPVPIARDAMKIYGNGSNAWLQLVRTMVRWETTKRPR